MWSRNVLQHLESCTHLTRVPEISTGLLCQSVVEPKGTLETLTSCADGETLLTRVLVMSATLGGGLGERVADLLGQPHSSAPLLVSEGRAFPVRTVYTGGPGASHAVADIYGWHNYVFWCMHDKWQAK